MALEEENARKDAEYQRLLQTVAAQQLKIQELERASQQKQLQEDSPVGIVAAARHPTRDLRYAMTFGPAIRARELADAEAARRQALESPHIQATSPLPPASPSPAVPAVSTSSSPAATTEAQKTPPAAASVAASPWGLRNLMSSALKLLQNQSASPDDVSETPSITTPSRRPRAERANRIGAPPKTPTPQTPAPQTPAPAVTEEASPSPVQSVRTERRRGTMKGFIYTPRGSASTPRRKPVEPNADKRATIIEQAAETKRIQAEAAAERKRIQEQASVLEEQKRNAENEQDQLDVQTLAQQQVGDKRKRVKIDDLKEIPARLPGESSGTFSFRDEFFTYNSDDSDDEVSLDELEADTLSYYDEQERPAKKMKINQNVFQATTPQKQATASATAAPSTPAPHTQQSQDFSIEQQKLRASQYKPKKPSGLGQSAPLTPRQISAMTPASQYFTNGHNNLSAISERTEPSQTPAASLPAPKFPLAAPLAPAAAAEPAASVDTAAIDATADEGTTFNFPQSQPLWVAYPDLYNQEDVEAEIAQLTPMSESDIEAAALRFGQGLAAWTSPLVASAA